MNGTHHAPQPNAPAARPGRAKRIALRVIVLLAVFFAGVGIGSAGSPSAPATGAAAPAPTVTVTGAPAAPAPAPTVTQTVAPVAAPNTTMAGDGVFVVGQDIRHGIYHTRGAIGGSGGNCYVATLSSTNTNNIIDNNNVTGPDTVTVDSSVKAVDTNGCLTWHRIGHA